MKYKVSVLSFFSVFALFIPVRGDGVNSAVYTLTADVDGTCNISFPVSGGGASIHTGTVPISESDFFSGVNDRFIGSISAESNFLAWNLTYDSTNDGFLVHGTDGTQKISYSVEVSPDAVTFTSIPLTGGVAYEYFSTTSQGDGGSFRYVNFDLTASPTSQMAGTYSDTNTITCNSE